MDETPSGKALILARWETPVQLGSEPQGLRFSGLTQVGA